MVLTLAMSVATGGCSDDDSDSDVGGQAFALSTIVFGPDQSSLFVLLLDSLEDANTDLANAREFPGSADMWVHNGFVYIGNNEDLSVTKFAVEGGQLVQQSRVSFSSFGPTSVAFWNNSFVALDKAYMSNGPNEYIVWNPDSMETLGTIELDDWAPPSGFVARHGFHDRSAVIRDGKLYHPFYFSDESFFLHHTTSFIAVVDIETDTVEEVLEAPCPGLDYVTRDDDDNLYFSSWVFAAGGAAVLEQPKTCIVQLAAGSSMPAVWSGFDALTSGLEGAALYHVGDGMGIFAALDPDRATGDASDAAAVTFGAHWRLWTVRFDDHSATLIEEVDWNAGAHYSWPLGNEDILLLPKGDFSATTAYRYELGGNASLTELLDTGGWAIRVFALP